MRTSLADRSDIERGPYLAALDAAERELEELHGKCVAALEVEKRTRIVANAVRQLRQYLGLEPVDLVWVDRYIYRTKKPRPAVLAEAQ